MPWAAGSYTKGNNGTGGWVGDASLGIGIEAGRHDTQDNDFATGINQCINKDGSNAFTGNANFGGFLPTNIAAGTASAPAICAGNDVNTGIFAPAADTWAVATNGTERMRVLSDGKVFIGRTSVVVGETFSSTGYAIIGDSTGAGGTLIAGWANGATVVGSYDNTPLIFRTNNTEKIRIDSAGNVLIGKTSTAKNVAGTLFEVGGSGRRNLSMVKTDSGSVNGVLFYHDGSYVGGLNYSDSATSLATSSDYRLKENVEPISSGIETVQKLKPCTFNFKITPDENVAGFIAHELQEVIPGAVFGEKDATEIVDGEEKIKPQSIDTNKLIPFLTAAIKELNAKVEALEAQVAALTPAPVEEPEA